MAYVPNALADQNLQSFSVPTSSGSEVRGYGRGLEEKSNRPILVLIHGYPQTNYKWRHLIRLLPKDTRLYVPDVPGYGFSTPSKTTHDKLTIGKVLVEALAKLTPSEGDSTQRIILIAHDRGARISHHLAVAQDAVKPFTLLGTVLIDIVPIATMWSGEGKYANTIVGSFHWPFLANVELATTIISEIGGDIWTKRMIERWQGENAEGIAKMQQDEGLQPYLDSFKNLEVIKASCEDYQAGASIDNTREHEDLEKGRLIEVPVLALHSAGLGRTWDVESAWRKRVRDSGNLKVVEIGGGIGHFVAEEAPGATLEEITKWLQQLGISF